jgi:hypothetical protein
MSVKKIEGHMILLHITQQPFFFKWFFKGFGQVVLMFLTGVGHMMGTKMKLG